jgi:DAK2 domain fusion protein YloV
MQTLERLDAAALAAVMTAYRDVLRMHQEAINRLNVYPVPDGDTGTNMALTLESVVRELAGHDADDLAGVAGAISHGSLMGARGNSGVILSQILRGLSDEARAAGERGSAIDGAAVVAGLRRAADDAYRAVQQPVEGTILTVARAAADGAATAAERDPGLVAVLEAARAAAAEALARTPDLLPVLKSAGVVDSGGAGLLLLFDALLSVTDGRPLPPSPDASAPLTAVAANDEPTVVDATDSDVLDLRYEVMYLLEAPDDTIPSFRDVWAGLGDSIVVVGGDGIWNCHIHTDDIGGAIEAALDAGRPRHIRVTDLWEEVEEERWVREATASGAPAPPESAEPVNCAVVAVCTGDGLRRIFHSLGVQQIVSGGQSMNPSTADLLAAIAAAPAEQVVVLPNNKNIVAVAEAAAAQASKAVRVVPTSGIQEGFAALLEYDPEGDVGPNTELMGASAARVVAGEVTRAVRDSSSSAGQIEAGDYLGMSRQGIEVVASTVTDASTGLLARLIDNVHHEIVTVIAGEGATPGDTRRISDWLEAHHPGISTEVHQGGQPLYPYLFSIE